MRKEIDCRDYPSVSGCTLKISGEEEEVLRAAMDHSVAVHGEKLSPDLKEKIRSSLKDEQPELKKTAAA